MATFAVPVRRSAFGTVPGVPGWARWAAHIAALAALPSGLWRLPMAWGNPMGFEKSFMDDLHTPGWGSAYVVGLSLVAELFALLTLGLIQPWGERFPQGMPWIGGRPILVKPVVIAAMTGAALVALYNVGYLYTAIKNPAGSPTGADLWFMHACYAPMLAWPPLLAAVTIHYKRRRSCDPSQGR
ncbi:hypothetical protein [Actinomadura terrae]|uniref:hypothetical protein n=1 Tax=Actinomadura terrae TaxID=604353 RepID=UPI001FA7682D|nr:hypothetical protein [Actinomadura terrae]